MVRVVVAMSGGVDSSVTALRLVEEGHEVLGVFLRNGVSHATESAGPRQGCCSVRDAGDAEEVAGILGVPFYSLDHSEGFDRIVHAFVEDYAAGRTPNPCVDCNRDLKFGELLRFARAMGAAAVATGHYARCTVVDGQLALRRARDRRKDQSYVLATVARSDLRRARFPLGELTKEEVRGQAERAGLPVHAKAESQEICFVPSGDYRDLLRERRPEVLRPGPIVDQQGVRLGTHPGAAGFTVGQRRGLGLGGHGPYYVLETDPEGNVVTVGPPEALRQPAARLRQVNWVRPTPDGPGACRLDLQVRAHHRGQGGVARWERPDQVLVALDPPGEVIAPGQVGVLYEGDRVVAAGRLERDVKPVRETRR